MVTIMKKTSPSVCVYLIVKDRPSKISPSIATAIAIIRFINRENVVKPYKCFIVTCFLYMYSFAIIRTLSRATIVSKDQEKL